MKTGLVSQCLVLAVAATLLAPAASAEVINGVNYIFKGDFAAKWACKHIVVDDASKLKSILTREKQIRRSLRPVDDAFKCNDQNLYVFAVDMDATKSQAHLLALDKGRDFYQNKGRVFIDEIAAVNVPR